MNIITITLNPAFDIHYDVENFQINKENYALSSVKQAGGKGINISRALSNFNVKNTAYCVVGKSSEDFLSILDSENLFYIPIKEDGKIRENITIHSNGKETRLSSECFKCSIEILDRLILLLKETDLENSLVTFTGRLPMGISTFDAILFLKEIKKFGAKIIVDCNSFSIEDLIEIKPYLIKPNEQEIKQLTDICVKSKEDAIYAASTLKHKGLKNVIISLGSKGFVYCGENGNYCVSVPEINPVSTIGAGDSLIAGFIAGLELKGSVEEVLKLAAAFGSAACLTKGTIPPEKNKIIELVEKIKISDGGQL